MISRNGLDTIEKISLGASFLGLLMAFQNPMYAIIPLFFNILIAFTRKKELEKQAILLGKKILLESDSKTREQQKSIDEISEQCDWLSSSIPNLKSIISGESHRISQLESQVPQEIDKIRQELNNLIPRQISKPRLKKDKEIGIPDIVSTQLQQENRLNELDLQIATISKLAESKFKESIKEVQELLAESWGFEFELVVGRKESRAKFIEALESAEKNLVMVCPWLSSNAIDEKVKNLIEEALDRGVCINIGWGNLSDAKKPKFRSENHFLEWAKNGEKSHLAREGDGSEWKYTAYSWLVEKEKISPSKLKLKLIGTHAKYLVCDDKFAMIGSHNFMTSSDYSNEEEFGIVLNDSQVLKLISSKFENSEVLKFSSQLPSYGGIENPPGPFKGQNPQNRSVVNNEGTDDTIPF
jgi:hypothetical protein